MVLAGEASPCFVCNFLVETVSDHLVVLAFFITTKLVRCHRLLNVAEMTWVVLWWGGELQVGEEF